MKKNTKGVTWYVFPQNDLVNQMISTELNRLSIFEENFAIRTCSDGEERPLLEVSEGLLDNLKNRKVFRFGIDYKIFSKLSNSDNIVEWKKLTPVNRPKEDQARLAVFKKTLVADLPNHGVNKQIIKNLLRILSKENLTNGELLRYGAESLTYLPGIGPVGLSNLIKFFINKGFEFEEYPLLNKKFVI